MQVAKIGVVNKKQLQEKFLKFQKKILKINNFKLLIFFSLFSFQNKM